MESPRTTNNDTRRISLPSGYWWEIRTRPLWKHVRRWTANHEGSSGRNSLIEAALAELTVSWGFPEQISIEALAHRDAEDVIAVLEIFIQEISPVLFSDDLDKRAEELLAGLVSGCVPPHFEEVHLMAVTGWDWSALQETPADVVHKMATYLAVRQARDTGGSLDFAIPEEGTNA